MRSRRAEVQDSLQSRYRVTRLGPGMLGIHGSDNSVRHAGGIIVLRRNGLYGSFDRARMPLNAIHGDTAELLAGDKAQAVPMFPGQRFYVVAVNVSDDAVTLGLLSTGLLSSGGKSGDVWGSLNFFFSKETIAAGQMEKISPEIDQWLLPEGSASVASAQAVAPAPESSVQNAALSPSAVSHSAAHARVELHPGMTREEVAASLGTPQREVSFGDYHWLEYPDMVAVIENGKLVSVDRNGQPPVAIKVSADPSDSEIYLDGKFVSSAPSVLRLAPGEYELTVKSPGFQDWHRTLKVLPGTDVNVSAKLSR